MNQTRLNNDTSKESADYHLCKEERETHYIYNEEDGYWIADSTIPRDIHKLEKQHWIETGVQYYKDGTVMAKQFKAPRNCLSPRDYNPNKPKSDKPKRVMSDELKQKMAEGRKKKKEIKAKENN
jgi:hypothetical protein